MYSILSKSPLFEDHKNNLIDSYDQFLSELREDIKEGHESDVLSDDFQEEFKELIFSSDLDQYHPLNFYWLNLIDKLVETIGLFEDEVIAETEDLIGAFSDSDLLGFIVEQLEAGVDVEQVIDGIFELQEIQIISFFHLHISHKSWNPNGPVSYGLVSEIGERNGHLFLGKGQSHFFVEDYADEPFIPVVGINASKSEIQVLVNDEVKTITSSSFETEKCESISFLPAPNKEGSYDCSHFLKGKRAYEVIRKLSPDLNKVLNQFTSFIVPIDEKEIVSFSMQVLPSYSSINMVHRDFVDLIDDLLHENGHHFLNSLLEGEEEILDEDDDKIFYSPWRRSLRPIRGIYHGMVTFYWAYRLFKELSLSNDLDGVFTPEEWQKIYFRFFEESILLKACYTECLKGHQLEKVTDFGIEIVEEIMKEINSDSKYENEILEKIDESGIKSIKDLELEIKESLKASIASH